MSLSCRASGETDAMADGASGEVLQTMLILGSSVANGSLATNQCGWAHMLALAVKEYGFTVENRAVGGTTVDKWKSRLAEISDAELSDPQVIIMSLSLGNEGLSRVCVTQQSRIDALTQAYVRGYRELAQDLRARMRPGARLVLGGPYPNDDYGAAHLRALLHVREAMLTWPEVDFVIDFLMPAVHDGEGHWHDGSSVNSGHPNDVGHAQMFSCLDVQRVLGPAVAVSEGGTIARGDGQQSPASETKERAENKG